MAGGQTSRTARLSYPLVTQALAAMGLIMAASCQPLPPSSSLPELPLPEKASPTPLSVATSVFTPTLQRVTPTDAPTETLAPLEFIKGSGSYVLPPTCQYINAHSATIVFEVESVDGIGLLAWEPGTDPRSGLWQPASSAPGVQAIELSDLTPDTDYLAAILEAPPGITAVVPSLLGEIWDPIRIHTLPEAGYPVRIAVMGDSGFGQAITHDLAQAMADRNPDLFIHTGDLVYNAHQEGSPIAAFQYKWFQTHAPILHEAAVLPVVGNHEMYEDAIWEERAYYFHAFPMLDSLRAASDLSQPPEIRRDWYQLAVGDIQFLFLNTQLFFGNGKRSEQNHWLEDRLSDPAYEASIVVFHVPPYTSGRHRLDGTAVIRSWVPLFEAHNVPLVLSGHDHNYEHLYQNGVHYIVSGGGSSILYDQGIPQTISELFFKQSHYLIIDLMADTISLAAYASDGSQLDLIQIDLN